MSVLVRFVFVSALFYRHFCLKEETKEVADLERNATSIGDRRDYALTEASSQDIRERQPPAREGSLISQSSQLACACDHDANKNVLPDFYVEYQKLMNRRIVLCTSLRLNLWICVRSTHTKQFEAWLILWNAACTAGLFQSQRIVVFCPSRSEDVHSNSCTLIVHLG